MNLELVTLEYSPSPQLAFGDEAHFGQMFTDLCKAMEPSGKPVYSKPGPISRSQAFLIERGAFLRIMAQTREIEEWAQVHVFSLSPQAQQLMCSGAEATNEIDVARFHMNK